MAKYYKITKDQAALIGKIMYAENRQFDPFVNEQTDGTYLVSDDMYNLLKERDEIKKVDFTKRPLIEKKSIDSKIFKP